MTIDWAFIGNLEGQRVLVGYVPSSGHSGVTIATGCDLGQWTQDDLGRCSPDLAAQLQPYIGLKGQAAVEALRGVTPILTITNAEADELDQLSRGADLALITSQYDRDSSIGFDALPDQAQTIIASVGFQYGNIGGEPGHPSDCPHFWAVVIVQDWPGTIAILRNFGDKYQTRRNKEADLLSTLIPIS